MSSNFSFINENKLIDVKNACIEAEKGLSVTPATSAILSRRALELAVKWVYGVDEDLVIPYQQTLSALIYNSEFVNVIEEDIHRQIIYIQKLGNQSVHSTSKITRNEALLSLKNLHDFLLYITYLYCDNYEEHKFDESALPSTENNKILEKERINLLEQLSEKDKTIEELQKQFEQIRKSGLSVKKQKVFTLPYDVENISEYETRKKYIDLDLKIAGWELDKTFRVELPVDGMPNNAGIGKVDYVLFGTNGKPLALVEAKKTLKDARVGQQQAQLYADCLESKYGQRPIIYFTNGFDIYMWDDLEYPYRKVSGYYTQDELQLLIDRRKLKRDLSHVIVDDKIAGRTYQQEAIKEFCSNLNNKKRKGLLVMATGTGKTRTAVSIVDVLINNNWAKNILFLADRTELVKQAKKSFSKLLPSLSTINLVEEKEDAENARMVFSTYNTMMNAIDNVHSKDGNKTFTVGHFDLIIVDEAHRSIYKKYQAIFDYFDGYLLGLTATPRSDLDKNTYKIFELEDDVPTYSYEYGEAVSDGFLVDYHTIQCPTNFVRDGIKYNELSEKDRELFEETFSDDESIDEHIESSALFNVVYNNDTIDKVLDCLMDKGLKVESNDKLGKTIIFAKNHRHAVQIEERFNKLYPQYGGQFARVIDIHTNYVSDLIEKFADCTKMPQIAISVDMLDTGIDIPEIVNLVFFKEVKSKVKFLQMIGRGTRLCEDLFGYKKDKKEFYIFDVCNNFEFFSQNPKGKETGIGMGLSQFIFELKIDLVKELEKFEYLDDEDYVNYKNLLLEDLVQTVSSLNVDKFDVKQKLKYVEKYKNIVNWSNLTDLGVKEIKDNLTNLVMSNDSDECAKQFDKLMYSVSLSKMLNVKYEREVNRLYRIGGYLRNVNIKPVQDKMDYLVKIMDNSYIKDCSIFDIDLIRNEIRELMKYIDRDKRPIYFTDFTDYLTISEDDIKIEQYEFEDYKKKVNFYLKNHLDNEVIEKIRNNEEVSKEELNKLQEILFNDLNSNETEFRANYSEESLVLLIRKTVGLSKDAIDREFAKFSNDYELNVEQTRFINLIKSYIMKNGVIDKRILMDDPFTSYGSILDLFNGNKTIIALIVAIIDLINKNGCFVQETN